MATKKKGLGRGLESLFINTEINIQEDIKKHSIDGLQKVDINSIKRNKNQPRKLFDEEKIMELSNSIKEHGVIQPIIVRNFEGNLEIVAGERRWRAAKKAGLKEIPVIVKDISDEQNILFAIIENLQRENLNPIEEAEGIQEMANKLNLTQDEISKSLSKSRPYITNSLRLLKLTDEVKGYLIDGSLSSGHGRALVSVDNPQKQKELAKEIINKKLTVRDVEDIIANRKNKKRGKPAKRSAKGNDVILIERELKEIWGTKVIIDTIGKHPVVKIECYNNEELERIIENLRNI